MRKIILKWLGIEKYLHEIHMDLIDHRMVTDHRLNENKNMFERLDQVSIRNLQKEMVALAERVKNLYRPKWDQQKIQIQYYRRLVEEGFNKPYDYPPVKRQQQKNRKQK